MSSHNNYILNSAIKDKKLTTKHKMTKTKSCKKISLGGESNLMWWNKGNSDFSSKKDEIEVMIDKYKPAIFGILEANMGAQTYAATLEIQGYICA